MITSTDYIEDKVYGQRLLISVNADQRELHSNIRAARAILHSFADITIIINAHTMSFGHKNPEYTSTVLLKNESRRYSTNGFFIRTVAELDAIAPICNSHSHCKDTIK